MNYLIGHLIGDYMLQSDIIAAEKKSNTMICLWHCLLYTAAIWVFTQWTWWILPLIFVQHFIQDRTQLVPKLMDITGSQGFKKEPFYPWSIIVWDNTLHLTFLWILEKFVI